MHFMLKTLEFDLICEQVAYFAKTDRTKNELLDLKPDTDLKKIERMLNETNDMTQLIARLSLLPLIDDYDISELFKMLEVSKHLSLLELLHIRLFLSMEKDVINYFNEAKRQQVNLYTLKDYVENINSHHHLLIRMDEVIDPQGLILDQATPTLYTIRKTLIKLDQTLQSRLQKLLTEYASYLNEYVITIRNDRFCIPVKETYKNKIKGVIHDVSASKQTVYIEPEQTRQITAEIETQKALEKQEIELIIRELSLSVYQKIDTLKQNLNVFFSLDTLSAKARYALKINATKPTINQNQTIRLIKARHPLLEPESVVPISLELNEHEKTILITGPNTGGKTVALKTVGLLTLMMQSGLLVPANEQSELAVFKAVFADIGDEQSIMQSLSTFSSHMKKIVNMLTQLEDDMLILLDEIGSGTDPNEGVCLAISILDAFMEKDIRMMVTTHYSELKSYAYEKKGVITASVAFDKKSLKPLYYLNMRTTGSSHAFLIAERLGLQMDILTQAKKLYQGRQTDLAQIMEKLSEDAQALNIEKEKVDLKLKEAKIAEKHYLDLKEKLLLETHKVIEKTKEKEEKKWLTLKEEATQLIKELSLKKNITQPEYATYKHQLNQNISHTALLNDDSQLSIGDEVFILSYQQVGVIKDIKKDQYRVIFGHFDLWFDRLDLKKETQKQKPRQKISRTTSLKSKKDEATMPKKEAKLEIDLRGFRYEDVHHALDQALDQAMFSGLSSLRVIHGFGTGAVRNAVYTYIKSSPYIKSHRYGGEGEGLNGVTIVTLK